MSWVKRNGGQVSQRLFMLDKGGLFTREIYPCTERGESPPLNVCILEGFYMPPATMKDDSAHALSLSQART